uniref:Klarsicht n=1 Tax=Macrostomum lignano TaxID=282301 RepID=A0A1I8H532_9PLAT
GCSVAAPKGEEKKTHGGVEAAVSSVQRQQQQPQTPPKQLQTRQPVKRNERQLKKPNWLSGGKSRQSGATSAAAATAAASGTPKMSNGSNGKAKTAEPAVVTGASTAGKERQTQPPKTLTQETSRETEARVVVAELTPTPDSANRTWSEDVSLPPPTQESQPVDAKEAKTVPGHRQRDSGISQLSTEEFERAFEELASRCEEDRRHRSASPEPATSPPEETEERHELLGPRLRPQRSPTMRHQARGAADAAAAAIVATEEQLLLRQELLMTPSSLANDSGRHSACSVINDDHLFPDAVTPCKVDSGLLNDYDVPYMDDETFFVLDDWYITDDSRWSYLRRSEAPQLASFEDCQLTVSGPTSPKAMPHGIHRGRLFGLCFGLKKSRA